MEFIPFIFMLLLLLLTKVTEYLADVKTLNDAIFNVLGAMVCFTITLLKICCC